MADGANPLADLEAVEPGQHEVEDDEIDRVLVELPQRFVAVPRLDDAVAVALERKGQELLDGFLVVDQEDGGGVRHEPRREPDLL